MGVHSTNECAGGEGVTYLQGPWTWWQEKELCFFNLSIFFVQAETRKFSFPYAISNITNSRNKQKRQKESADSGDSGGEYLNLTTTTNFDPSWCWSETSKRKFFCQSAGMSARALLTTFNILRYHLGIGFFTQGRIRQISDFTWPCYCLASDLLVSYVRFLLLLILPSVKTIGCATNRLVTGWVPS